MATPTELTFARAGLLDQLMASDEPTLFETHPGGRLLELRPMLFPVAHAAVDADHRAGSHYFPIGLTSFRDTLVFEKMFIGDKERVFTSSRLHPFYIDSWINQGRFNATTCDFSIKRCRTIDGPVFVVSNAHHIYGHWLLECVPKLLYLKHSQHILPAIRILLNGTPSFAEAWVRYILPDADIVCFRPDEEYVRCERLLVPTMICTQEYNFHLLLNEFIDDLIGETPHPIKQIYLTRESESGYRYMENESAVRAIAQDFGLLPVSPETLAIPQQIALFTQSRLVVGDFGSALHNAIFSGPHTAVVALNFINGLQSRIARLRRQRIGFVLPASGSPLLYRENVPRRGYRIDLDTFRRSLDIACNS